MAEVGSDPPSRRVTRQVKKKAAISVTPSVENAVPDGGADTPFHDASSTLSLLTQLKTLFDGVFLDAQGVKKKGSMTKAQQESAFELVKQMHAAAATADASTSVLRAEVASNTVALQQMQKDLAGHIHQQQQQQKQQRLLSFSDAVRSKADTALPGNLALRPVSPAMQKLDAEAALDRKQRSFKICMQKVPKTDLIRSIDAPRLSFLIGKSIEKATAKEPIKDAVIVATTRLARGDLQVLFKTKDEALARQEEWIHGFHANAFIKKTRYWVITSQVEGFDVNSDVDRQAFYDANAETLHRETDVVIDPWRPQKKKKQQEGPKKHEAYLIGFTEAQTADRCIARGLIMNQQMIRAGRFVFDEPQCFRCQKIGHTSVRCSRENPACAICAGDHNTRNHPCTATEGPKCGDIAACQHRGDYKCINCGGKHPAWARECRFIKERKERFWRKWQSTDYYFGPHV